METDRIGEDLAEFQLPGYEEIPDVGLYLKQTVKYISSCLEPLGSVVITGSMVSNYVKQKLIPNPVRKQYSRPQIATLLFIAVAKSVLSIEEIRLLLEIQKSSYDEARAYRAFCREMKENLRLIAGKQEEPAVPEKKLNMEQLLLRNTMISVTHKIYLNHFFAQVMKEKRNEGREE